MLAAHRLARGYLFLVRSTSSHPGAESPHLFPTGGDFSMPNLESIPPIHANVVYWGRLLLGMPTDRFVPSALLVTVARLCDQALDEYTAARYEMQQHLRRQWNPDITYLMRATNRMEAFLGTLWRLVGLGEAVRRAEDAPAVPRDELPTKRDFERLNGIRRAVEHMDERIRDGRVGPGDPTMVVMGDNSVSLERWEIAYDELAWWLCLESSLVLRLRAFETSTPSEEWPGLLRAFAAASQSKRASQSEAAPRR